MGTPICDFVAEYKQSGSIRMHMPGHKGIQQLGPEPLDITEICGADSLYMAEGIIAESERRTTALFGAKMTLYSTEGSSQCIRSMLALIRLHMQKTQRKGYILAARNVHKSFVSAAGLLDLEVRFLESREDATLLYAPIDLAKLQKLLAEDPPTALYITSPDYLGSLAPISELSALCHRYGVLLAVDNAHGAYLRFLSPSLHPMDLGADLCCDSAHKTLPALTGAAYLHLAGGLAPYFYATAKETMALFGSTSPSYLILASLDLLTETLKEEFPTKLSSLCPMAQALRTRLLAHGFTLAGDEPMKLTVLPKSFGHTGNTLAALLRERGIECEFSDEDSLVLMLSPYLEESALLYTAEVLTALPRRAPISVRPPRPHIPRRACSIREAMLAPSESVSICEAQGRTLSALCVSCPPAVPPIVCGEVLDADAIDILAYYGITRCSVKIDR